MSDTSSQTISLLTTNRDELVNSWVESQLNDPRIQSKQPNRQELSNQSREIINTLIAAVTAANGDIRNVESVAYKAIRDLMADVSIKQEQRGFTPFETATSFTYLKEAWAGLLQHQYKDQADVLAREMLSVSRLLDNLNLVMLETMIKRRESTIVRQTQNMIEISTPVIKLWTGIVAVPLIGTLDSQRAQVVTANLLQSIVDTGSSVAIIDITGVPTVDTLVAQHLIQTVAAARLMGAECIISGIRPHIAQTIVHLGITLENVTTKASLADAFLVALQRVGLVVSRKSKE